MFLITTCASTDSEPPCTGTRDAEGRRRGARRQRIGRKLRDRPSAVPAPRPCGVSCHAGADEEGGAEHGADLGEEFPVVEEAFGTAFGMGCGSVLDRGLEPLYGGAGDPPREADALDAVGPVRGGWRRAAQTSTIGRRPPRRRAEAVLQHVDLALEELDLQGLVADLGPTPDARGRG